MQQWIQIGLDTGIPWPTTEVAVSFDGRQIFLTPSSEDLLPTAALETKAGESAEEARAVLNRFLSSLSWVWDAHARNEISSGGSGRIRLGRSLNRGIRIAPEHFRCDYVPEPSDKEQRLALALYREALSVNSVPYKFLGFFKILNIRFCTKSQQEGWVNRNLANLQDHEAVKRIGQIQASNPDVGTYLYVSGRCAVAHAATSPVVDPDDPADLLRLTQDLPVAKALAQLFIEKELGIRTRRTVLYEHLYELEGFRELLGPTLVSRLKKREAVAPEEIPRLPPLGLGLDGEEPYEPFDHLEVCRVGVKDGRMLLVCQSKDRFLTTQVVLDFPEERLCFDPSESTHVTDDGSALVVSYARSKLALLRDLLQNGIIIITDASSGKRLGRSDPFMALNLDLNRTLDNLEAEIKKLERLALLRGAGEKAT